MKKFFFIVIVGLTMASLQLKAQSWYYDSGVFLHGGWAMDWNNLVHGFNPSKANVAAYYFGVGFVGIDTYFPSKDDGSFRLDLKGGLDVDFNIYILDACVFSPYLMAGYTHYKNDLGLPEVSIGYGGMLNIILYEPVGIYLDFHKAHYLGENYIPQKDGPLVLSLGLVVIIQ